MKTLAPEIWFWTSKIMPDLWLSDVFCQIQKKKITPPYFMCTWYEYEYNHSACKATTHGAFAHHPLASAHHPLSFFSLYLRSSFLFWPLITVLLHNPLDSVHHPLSSLTSTHHPLSSFSQGWASVLFKRTQRSHILLRSFKRTKRSRVCILYKKNAAFFVFFYILYKRTLRSLRSFTFFIKERSVVCILLHSL